MHVLSIDIDYAYSPTISTYDDYVEGSRVTLEEQQEIMENLGMPKPKVNPEKIKLLKEVVRKKTTHLTPIIICEHHDEIVRYLPKTVPFSIVNFDHHHDVYYPGWHDKDVLDEGNWVYHLNNSPIMKYTWVRNPDSENLPEGLELNFILGATPAIRASSHLRAHKHHLSPAFNPGKLNSGLAVVRSFPLRFVKSRNSSVIIAQTVWVP